MLLSKLLVNEVPTYQKQALLTPTIKTNKKVSTNFKYPDYYYLPPGGGLLEGVYKTLKKDNTGVLPTNYSIIGSGLTTGLGGMLLGGVLGGTLGAYSTPGTTMNKVKGIATLGTLFGLAGGLLGGGIGTLLGATIGSIPTRYALHKILDKDRYRKLFNLKEEFMNNGAIKELIY